jgi:hypothetical protein
MSGCVRLMLVSCDTIHHSLLSHMADRIEMSNAPDAR